MPREGTKAAEIMRLYNHRIFTIQEIAEAVGCKPEYVRVVARQRKGSSQSEIDRRYLATDRGMRSRAEARARKNAAYHSLPRDVRRDAFRTAYHSARTGGASVKEATQAGNNAVSRRAREAANA